MSARRNNRVYIEDIGEAIDRIDRYTAAGKEAFFSDEKTQDAVIRQLSIIGEAAARIPPKVKDTAPDVPWQKVVGMRNILIHEYSNTSIHRVWDTVQNHLPQLAAAIGSLLSKDAGSASDKRRAA